jgi:NAD(P)-dependent dehydrogenase (short-subunit alcohol dehydrogenase family)
MEQWPISAAVYGASKAALNWITKNIHIENSELIAFLIHPGHVSALHPHLSYYFHENFSFQKRRSLIREDADVSWNEIVGFKQKWATAAPC